MNIQTLLIEIDELQKKIEKLEAEKLVLKQEIENLEEIIYEIQQIIL
jgi:cell division protein FtsB